MKTGKFITGIALGSFFALLAAVSAGVLLAHLYYSSRVTLTVFTIEVILSLLCFGWALRSGIARNSN
ncbi:hypothetical protein [Tunturiibacter gelidiferens]|uniref:Uncharacterized protein n=1 Tax=Tunturiibacter gelidiferens TaxID=3069689 RepID=A0AAU7YWG0_9BACT